MIIKNLTVLTFLAVVTFGLSSCGKEYVHSVEYKAQDFEGFYKCSNNSQVELIADFNNRVSFETYGQSLNSINPKNQTLATHPTVSEKDLLIVGNSLIINPRNYTYSSSTHDVEQDASGANITGNKRTDIKVTRLESKINIEFIIYANANNSNINSITAQRVVECEKL